MEPIKRRTSNYHPFQVSDGVSLRDYMDIRFDAIQKAVEVANKAMDTRLEGMNEFRDTLKDQAAKFITREEMASTIKPICENIKALERIADMAQGKATLKSVILTAAVAAGSLIVGIFNLFKH